MCGGDPQHKAYKYNRFLGFIALALGTLLASCCPTCWRGRIIRWAS